MQEENKNLNLHQPNDKSRWTFSKPVQRRSSLFGKTFDWKDQNKQSNDLNTDLLKEQYHTQILTELKEWDDLLKQKSSQLGELEKLQLLADETVLTEESSNYCNTGVHLLRQYARGLNDTHRLLNFYLEERMVLLEAKRDINDQLNQLADEQSANIIEDALED